jgi:triose/dihydroxyacetone kinase / FAD-AMP lyase (cyclizing)
VARAWSGAFLTAMEMPGISLSVVAVDEDLLRYLDAPVRTAAWPTGSGGINPSPSLAAPVAEPTPHEGAELSGPGRFILDGVLRSLERAEPELTVMDQRVGDGDLGHSLERGARAVLAEGSALPARPDLLLRRISALARKSVGGTSGPLYAVFLLKASEALQGIEDPQAGDWARALARGLEGIQDLGGARPGDRTMLDALAPAADALAGAADQPLTSALQAAADAARSGAEATADMAPRRGRSSYAGDRVKGHVDPGAWAVHLWLAAAAQAAATVTAESSARP